MNPGFDSAAPGPRPARSDEQEAVLTTIVGSRPPGSGQKVGQVPRGIEVLIKKAAVDADFKELLLTKRAEAAKVIGLELNPAEALMLAAVPSEQLEKIIAQTSVPPEHRRAFLGQAAAAMLAALGVMTSGCGGTRGVDPDRPKPPRDEPIKGILPDKPPKKEPATNKEAPQKPEPDPSK